MAKPNLEELKCRCQAVLPAVYDDCLSYYELLSKVVAELNKHAEYLNDTNEDIISIVNALKELTGTEVVCDGNGNAY